MVCWTWRRAVITRGCCGPANLPAGLGPLNCRGHGLAFREPFFVALCPGNHKIMPSSLPLHYPLVSPFSFGSSHFCIDSIDSLVAPTQPTITTTKKSVVQWTFVVKLNHREITHDMYVNSHDMYVNLQRNLVAGSLCDIRKHVVSTNSV